VKSSSRLLLPSLLIIALVIPWPFMDNQYIRNTLVTFLLYAILAQNWNLLFSHAGIWSFGQLALFAIGGYGTGLMSKFLGISPWATMIIASLMAAAAGLAIGLVTLRVGGMYFALVTFGLQFALLSIILAFYSITGGRMGLYNIPSLTIGSFSLTEFGRWPYYYVLLLIFLVSNFVIKKMLDSNIGLALAAVRDSTSGSLSLGINPLKYRLMAFGLSCFFTGLAGASYGHYFEFIDPTMISFSTMVTLFLIIIIGGRHTFHGPTLGALIWIIASELMRPLELLRYASMGILVIVLIIFLPSGLYPMIAKSGNSVKRHLMRSQG